MEERGRKGRLADDFKQIGSTCGVYSLAYALDKLGIECEKNPMDWAIKVAFDGNVGKGCNPIALTTLALKLTSGKFDVQFYADIEGLIECVKSDHDLKSNLEYLDKLANECLGTHYIKADYDYDKSLHEGEVCIGIFAVETLTEDDVKKEFLKQFKANPASLHYMMIQKQGTKYFVFDSNVGPNKPIEIINRKVSSTYTYSGLAIVLSKKEEK